MYTDANLEGCLYVDPDNTRICTYAHKVAVGGSSRIVMLFYGLGWVKQKPGMVSKAEHVVSVLPVAASELESDSVCLNPVS